MMRRFPCMPMRRCGAPAGACAQLDGLEAETVWLSGLHHVTGTGGGDLSV